MPREFSLVKFNYDDISEEYHQLYPFDRNASYLFLKEIINMPDHCVVVDVKTGQVFIGYHTDNFIELTEEEL